MAAILAVSACGCGYTSRASLDPKYQTIHVSPFQNRSREYDMQAALTTALIRKFVNDGRLRVVGRDNADLVIEGVIVNYDLKGLAFDTVDAPTQISSSITATVRLIDGYTDEVIWEDPRLSSSTTFSTGVSGGPSERARGNTEVFLPVVRSFLTNEENRAASEVLEALASDIFYRTVELW